MAALIRWTARPAGRNDVFTDLLAALGPCTPADERELIVRRDAYREAWRHAMKKQEVDFILTPPHALPPMPHGGTGIATLVSSNYEFLYNIVRLAIAHSREAVVLIRVSSLITRQESSPSPSSIGQRTHFRRISRRTSG